MHVNSFGIFVVEEVVDVAVLKIDPRFRKRHHIVEPSDLAQSVGVIVGVVVLPEGPRRGKLKFGIEDLGELFTLGGNRRNDFRSTLFLFRHF